ncbi:MAG: MarR family winged helix-turn-helix transcriptional regulator [Stellaceae bacterium]
MLELLLSRAVGTVYSDRFGLKTDQWRVLAAVAVWGPIEANEISRRATVDKAAISRAVRALLAKDLLVRSPHEQDGRRMLLELTSKGRRTFDTVIQRIAMIQSRLFEGSDRREIRAFFRILLDLESKLREMQEEQSRRSK